MATTAQEFITTIRLNSEDAKNKIVELQKQLDIIKQKRNQAFQQKDMSSFNTLDKELKKVQKRISNLTSNSAHILDNIDTSSIKQLTSAVKYLKVQQKNMADESDYAQMEVLIQKCTERIKEFKEGAKQATTGVKAMRDDVDNLSKVMQNIDTSSFNELAKAQTYLKKSMADMSPSSTSYATSLSQLKAIQQQMEQNNAKQLRSNELIDQYDREVADVKKDTQLARREQEMINQAIKDIDRSSYTQLDYAVKILNKNLKNVKQGTAEYRQLTEQLKRVKTKIEAINREQAASRSTFDKLWGGLNRNWGAITQTVAAISGLTITVRQCTQKYAEFEDVLANTRKYTGLSDKAVRELNEDLKKMDTRSSMEQLNDFAGAAGRLGIKGKQDIEDFVDGADKISVALGDDLGDGAVDKIGKLATAFGEDKRKGLRGAMLATGSALNELAQNSSANAGYIVDFTARMSGMGLQAKMSQQDIMGFASVMDQNMQESETSATALGQLITKMFQDPAKFAKLAGQNVTEFTELLKTDANAALIQFFQSMQAKGGFSDLAPMFDEMGLSGTRCVGIFSTVAQKLDDVKTAQTLANNAYSDGTSVIGEFNTVNNTENAKLDKVKKNFDEITKELGEKLLPVSRYGITTMSLAIKGLSAIINVFNQYKTTIVVLTAMLTAYTIVVNANIVMTKLQAIWNGVLSKSFTNLSNKMKANPYMLVAAGIALVISFMIDLYKNSKKVSKTTEDLNKLRAEARDKMVEEKLKTDLLIKASNNENLSKKERIKAIKQLQAIIPNYVTNLNKEGDKYTANKKALDAYNQSLMKKYELEGAKTLLADLGKKEAELAVKERKARITVKKTEDLRNNSNNQNRHFRSYNPTDVAFTNMNVDNSKKILKKTHDDLLAVREEKAEIMKIYGEDMQKDTANNNTAVMDQKSGDDTKTETEDKRNARKAEDEKRKAEAADLKAKKDADKAEKAEETKQLADNLLLYTKGEQSYAEYLSNREQIQKTSIDKRKQIWGADSDQAKQLADDELKAEQEHSEAIQKVKEQDITNMQVLNEARLNAEFYYPTSDIYQNEQALSEALFRNQQDANAKRLNLMVAGTQEWFDLKSDMQLADQQHQFQLQINWQKRLQEYQNQYGKADINQQMKLELNGIDYLYAQKLLKEEEYQEMRKQIELQYNQRKSEQDADNTIDATTKRNAHTAYETASNNATAKEGGLEGMGLGSLVTSDITHYSNTMEQLKSMYAQDAINYQEYQQAKKEASNNLWDGVTSKASTAIGSLNDILSAASSYYAAEQQYEENVTTKKYDKLISAAGNNTAKTNKLEAKKQKELAAIKTKYNKKSMKLELAQAVASTALAAINAYATGSRVSVTLGIIAAAMATAAGMIQIATIKKQHAAEEAGYYSGGYTGGSDYRKQAGVVHQGEFVVNHAGVNNPNVMPMLRLIDTAQRNNTIGALSASDVSRSMGGATVVSAPTVNVQTDNSELRGTIDNLGATVNILSDVLSDGINTNFDIEQFDKKYKHFNRLKSNV